MSESSQELNEPVALRRARFVVAYDGAAFRGFAENPGVATVMGVLRPALELVVRRPTQLTGAGRTDAGVHAWGQVISGDLPARTDLARLAHRLNRMCGPRVAVRRIEWAPTDDFSARFDARWRHYRYSIWNQPVANPLLASATWHLAAPLDLWAMRLACDPLIGEQDFTSFCRRPPTAPGDRERSMRRNVMFARWAEVADDHGPGLLRFEIRANAFCHQMVRALVGTLVDVGRGHRSAGDMRSLLLGRDRSKTADVAPPEGLCLWQVGYDD